MWRLTLREAWSNLWLTPSRTLLALIAIATAVSAVIATIEVSALAAAESARRFKMMGADLAVIQMAPPTLRDPVPLKPDDALSMVAELPDISTAVPVAIEAMSVGIPSRRLPTTLLGAPPELFVLLDIPMSSGRRFSPYDNGAMGAVLGSSVSQDLSTDGKDLQPGDLIEIGGRQVPVYGVMAYRAPNLLLPVDLNRSVVVPLATAARLSGVREVSAIIGRTTDTVGPSAVANIQRWFLSRSRPTAITIRTAEQVLESMAGQVELYSFLTGAIAAIALVIAAGSVANVMLMSVTERRHEIGVRMALGARRRDIRRMFLAEALMLSFAGALAGIVTGWLASLLIATIADWPFSFGAAPVLLGVTASAVCGALAGVIPASRASQLDPILALRAD
jgi:putative ABC transport system permease protein